MAASGNSSRPSNDLPDVSRPSSSKSPGSARKGPTKGSAKGSATPERKSAQQRLIEQREAAASARSATAQRKKLMVAVIPVVLVLIIVAVLVIVKVSGGGSTPKAGPTASAAADSVVSEATSVPLSALNAVGAGTVAAYPVSAGDAPALTLNGLPRVFYAGGEFCPYCAAERWAVVVALSRFGAWSGLGQTRSSASDVFPSTATFTFHGATFTGSVVAFSGYELYSNDVTSSGAHATLETLDAADTALMTKYDAAPYFPSDSAGSIPFIDIGGKYLISGASYSPAVLAGKDQAQIAAALSDPTSDIAKAVLGTANVITAAICKITNGAPASVCTSSGVVAAAAKLPTS